MTPTTSARARSTTSRRLIALVLFGMTVPVQAVVAAERPGIPAIELIGGNGNGNGNSGNGNGNFNQGDGNGNFNQGNDNGNDSIGSFNGNFNQDDGNGNGRVGNGFGNGFASNCVSNNGRDTRDDVIVDLGGTRMLIHCHCLLTRNTSSAHNCIEIRQQP